MPKIRHRKEPEHANEILCKNNNIRKLLENIYSVGGFKDGFFDCGQFKKRTLHRQDCECGAKYDRNFPGLHSKWCPAYRGEW
mgnify:CR=1 FL=1